MHDMNEPRHIPATRPTVTGPVDANIFAVMGAATRVLKRAGLREAADEMVERMRNSHSYDVALGIAQQYVDFDL